MRININSQNKNELKEATKLNSELGIITRDMINATLRFFFKLCGFRDVHWLVCIYFFYIWKISVYLSLHAYVLPCHVMSA